MNPFLSTYNQDYVPIKQYVTIVKKAPQEFPDPLMESYKNYLQLSSAPEPPPEPMEDCDKYLKKVATKKPKIAAMHLENPVDNAIMQRQFTENSKTNYQCDYCDFEKDEAYKEEVRKKNLFRLPDDYVLPSTIQQYSYRNPKSLNWNAYDLTRYGKPPSNLDPEPHIQALLKVKTGESDYGGTIGALGEIIITQHVHGKVDHLKCLVNR